MADDYAKNTSTTGAVTVGGTATGEIETGNDFDWFAVELVAGRTYAIDLEGSDSGGGTLDSTVLRGIYDSDGDRISGTQTNDGGDGDDARLTFTATESGTHYIAARGYGSATGTYTVRVTDTTPAPVVDADAVRSGALDLGDITDRSGPRFPNASLDGDGDRIDYFRFTLSEAKKVGLGLRRQDADADLILEDAEGNVLHESTASGTANEWISETLLAGTYYVRVEAQEAGANAFKLRYGVSAADAAAVAVLEGQQQQQQGQNQAPAFVAAGFAFELAENADGSAAAISLGSLTATDADEDDTLTYSIVGGNDAGLFAIDSATGALSYVGAGEDYESGTTSYELTVRASDGSAHADASVTVSVTDVVEPDISVSDAEAEESDGPLRFRVTLSEATAAPVSVNYATADGTAVAGEDYTSASGTLTFAPGETEKVIEVSLIDDDVEDSGETLTLTLSGAVGGSLEDASATGTILNTEDPQTVSEGDTDLPGSTATTGRIAFGESATGEIERSGDRDWFAVTLEAGNMYRFDLKGSHTGDGTLRNPVLRGVHDSEGILIDGTTNYNGGDGKNSRVMFKPSEDGTYYVSAGGHGSSRGTYTLSLKDADDFSAGTDTAGVVEVDGSVGGVIEFFGDRDWFAVELEAGGTYRIDLAGRQTGDGTLWDPYLHGIYDSGGSRIHGTTNNDGGDANNSRVTFTATEGGTYYVSAGVNGNYSGSYTLSIKDVDDFLAGTGTSGAVTVDGSVRGEITFNGDRDWFAVTLEAGKVYQFDLKGSGDNDELRDPFLRGIHDSNGSLIGYTSDPDGGDGGEGRNSRVQFSPTEDGTYYVSAGAQANYRVGTYTLSVTDVTDDVDDDYTAGTGTTGTVAVDGSVMGEIDYYGDRDWYKVTLESGKIYRIDLEGSGTERGTLNDPHLRGIYDSGANRIHGTSKDDGGTGDNSRLFFVPTEAGDYYVSASADRGFTKGLRDSDREGTYTLSVTDVTDEVADDYTAGTDTTGTVTVGSEVAGEIDYVDDRDWFKVTLEADTTYQIDLEGIHTGRGTLWGSHLIGIYDGDGDLIAGTTNAYGGTGNNSRVTFTATEAGAYYVSAAGWWEFEGTYTLSVDETM